MAGNDDIVAGAEAPLVETAPSSPEISPDARAKIAELTDLAAREIGELFSLRTALAERDATIERLTKLVYVPGLWKCPKCKFSLVQANLNASDGTVTARDQPGDKCPNCASPLWRVTERDAGNEMVDRAEEYLVRATTAERERDEARAEVERLRPALSGLLRRVAGSEEVYGPKHAITIARVALAKGGSNGDA
ncbi:hypothetical protein [Xanthobacter flavus]|uniref:hypothetical protein n=1 Tax=Xanthobacter flavus TaxID=281 RepID=UPI003726F27A